MSERKNIRLSGLQVPPGHPEPPAAAVGWKMVAKRLQKSTNLIKNEQLEIQAKIDASACEINWEFFKI